MSNAEQAPHVPRWVVGAWTSVALIPVFLVAVSYAALTFYRETRYDTGDHYVPEWVDGMPWWAVLLQALVSIVVVAVPCLLAMWCGRRATEEGDARGRRPRLVGAVCLVGYAVLTLATAVTNLVSAAA